MSSTPATIPFAIFDNLLEQTYGVLLAGVFTGCLLFGILVLQVFLYYSRKMRDPLILRVLPAFLIVMEFIHQMLLCVAVYKIVINNFGNEGVAVLIIPELFIASFFQGFCAVSAQLFYTYRIWKFSNKFWIVPCVTIPLMMTQLGFTFANNALTLIHRDIAYLQTITYTVYVVHSVNVFLDLFFVIVMVFLLSKERQVFKYTQTMVHRLLMLTINTGLMTTIATALTIVFVAAKPDTFIYAFFNILVSSLYGNSVMANLNSRDYVRGDAEQVLASNVQFHELTMNPSYGRSSSATRVRPSKGLVNEVTISQATVIKKDSSSDYTGAYKSGGDV
ncbi:hypothetical protein P691DRAFT_777759 [Macrolepiota fuliginosa MF-IS2]|uniref:DUF6534 domain-containing protein n=1 Tax=Macrolepiota fuliginosa MF-IS2 TaxID=1400762 RepID=A0A9P6BYH4_9AGAR|nr:hypothetical protein P691DRAFT_777759 [Macrolepiota fuliginosa MF-IS2]